MTHSPVTGVPDNAAHIPAQHPVRPPALGAEEGSHV